MEVAQREDAPIDSSPACDEESLDMKKKRELERKAKQEEKMRKFEEKKKKMDAQEKLKEQKGKSEPKENVKSVKSESPAPLASLETPVGEKKDFSAPMSSAYDPIAVEHSWFAWWEKQKFFKPEYSGVDAKLNPKGRFVMVIPPPNVTGSLHLGHALTNAIQDAVTRWHRMRGITTLWNPGCDHAGIATQVVVEKKLMRERKQSRHDLGRDAFVSEIWKWKEQYGDRIYSQLRRMGSSYDWDRAVFTMDDKCSRAVKEAFVRLYDDGYIYRSTRLVNWCSVLKTAISNVEVEYRELSGRTKMTVPGHGDTEYEFGVLTEFAYFLENDPSQEIVVSTLRLETMLGDVAVAVHPTDPRYLRFHGKYLTHPLLLNRRIPVIVDTMVDPQFATGAVKITPGHDFNDFECGKRHQLPCINVLSDDGCMNDTHPLFQGMKRFDARNKMLEMAKAQGWYRGQRDHAVNVPVCSRTGDVVEPMIKPQWFVKSDVMSQRACEAVRSGALEIIPRVFEKTWFSWMENLNDWCISRQLWWGHRIPAYKIIVDQHATEDSEHWVAAHDEQEALQRAHQRFPKMDPASIRVQQDEDVLDTWFSAALFPFSIFGWPDNTADLRSFYPTSLLETGHDILFFWVARMVMLGQTLTGELPFRQVYLHAMIRDAHGRKMSKSLGNVIDPLDVIEGVSLDVLQRRLDESNLKAEEIVKAKLVLKDDYPEGIPQCGTDALRFALCAYTLQARDINLNVKRIHGYRQFGNKIWNATKFVLMKLGEGFMPWSTVTVTEEFTTGDRWILSRLEQCIEQTNRGFHTYDFPAATTAIYSFLMYEYCDVYIELAKSALLDERRVDIVKNVLYVCLHVALRLLSPFMPFITEELYHRLPVHPEEHAESICVARYPEASGQWSSSVVETEFEVIQQIAKAARSLVADYFKCNQKTTIFVQCKSESTRILVKRERMALVTLTRATDLHLLSEGDSIPEGCVVRTIKEDCTVYLLVKGLVNVEEEVQKLEKEKMKIQRQVDGLLKQMKMKDYCEKVPELVRESNDQKMVAFSAEMDVLSSAMSNFMSIK